MVGPPRKLHQRVDPKDVKEDGVLAFHGLENDQYARSFFPSTQLMKALLTTLFPPGVG
ncbi:MAG: hypothetical protein RL632_1569 [Bacteroidota bacterium]